MNFALKNTQEMHQKGLLFVCDAYVFRGQFGNIMVWYFLNIDIMSKQQNGRDDILWRHIWILTISQDISRVSKGQLISEWNIGVFCCWHVIRKAIWRNLEVRNLKILRIFDFDFFQRTKLRQPRGQRQLLET